jgi:hypothetical protein
MKKIVTSFLIGLILIHCSCSNNESSKKYVKEDHLQNDSENIKLINDIIHDTREQIPYIDNTFYVSIDYLNDLELTKKENDFIINQNNKVYSTDTIQDEGVKFYDTLSNSIKNSTIIKSKEEGYNKFIIQISRPYKLSENEVVIFYYGTILHYGIIQNNGNKQEGPAGGEIWAVRYKKINEKWTIDKRYSIADIA